MYSVFYFQLSVLGFQPLRRIPLHLHYLNDQEFEVLGSGHVP